MKLYDFSLIIIIAVVAVCALGGLTSVYFLGPDNAVEEVAEDVIEKQTGVKSDLSPSSKEIKKNKK